MNFRDCLFAFQAVASVGVLAHQAERPGLTTAALDLQDTSSGIFNDVGEPTVISSGTLSFLAEDVSSPLGTRGLQDMTCLPADDGSEVEYVDCVNGFVAGSNGATTCAAACEGLCCVGTRACDNFNGKVCKDGLSCISAEEACWDAIIGLVTRSCYDLPGSTHHPCRLSRPKSHVTISNSCHGNAACASISLNNGAFVGNIINSCQGQASCMYIANAGNARFGGDMIDSCIGTYACNRVATEGTVSYFFNSCNDVRACYMLGGFASDVVSSGLNSCCNTFRACDSGDSLNYPSVCADTSAPTPNPQQPPSTSPTKAPWDINYVSMDIDFSVDAASGNGEVDMVYEIPTDRVGNANHYIYRDHCDATVTESSKPAVDDGVVTTTNSTTDSATALYDNLNIFHRFNKTLIAGSNIWFNETNEIRLCQVIEMIETHDGEVYTITQNLRNITVEFNLTTEFEVDVDLTGATILAESANTTLNDYISAWYCDDTMAVYTAPLAPNEKLHICVESSSADVELEAMTMIKILGTNNNGDASELTIVEADSPVIPAITSHSYPSSTQYMVETMVPIGFFNFEAEGAAIDVVGSLTLNLVGERRRLEVSIGVEGRELQEGGANTAGFDVSVPLVAGEGEEELAVFSAGAAHEVVVAGVALALGLAAVW